MTTIQDSKLIEKLEVDEMKLKEEERNKKEREEHEKRVKIFEQKQMMKNHEKQSNKHKEKSEESTAVEKKANKKKDTHNGKSKNEKKKGTRGNDEKDKNVRPELTCCYPDGCSQKNRVLNRDDLSETQRVSCSNSKCDQSGYMHLACFSKFESMVVGFLGKQPRGRMR